MNLRSPPPTLEPRNLPSMLWASAGVTAGNHAPGRSLTLRQTREEKPPSPPQLQSPNESEDFGGDLEFPIEPSESEDHSQTSSSLLRNNNNCRTYRRPNKQGSNKASDSSTLTSSVFGSDPPKAPSDTNNKTVSGSGVGGAGAQGRTRDFTVLHPSCVSMFNVTIQERGMEEFSGSGAPASGSGSTGSGGTTDVGEAVWQKKKTEPAPTKPRYTFVLSFVSFVGVGQY